MLEHVDYDTDEDQSEGSDESNDEMEPEEVPHQDLHTEERMVTSPEIDPVSQEYLDREEYQLHCLAHRYGAYVKEIRRLSFSEFAGRTQYDLYTL